MKLVRDPPHLTPSVLSAWSVVSMKAENESMEDRPGTCVSQTTSLWGVFDTLRLVGDDPIVTGLGDRRNMVVTSSFPGSSANRGSMALKLSTLPMLPKLLKLNRRLTWAPEDERLCVGVPARCEDDVVSWSGNAVAVGLLRTDAQAPPEDTFIV